MTQKYDNENRPHCHETGEIICLNAEMITGLDAGSETGQRTGWSAEMITVRRTDRTMQLITDPEPVPITQIIIKRRGTIAEGRKQCWLSTYFTHAKRERERIF